MSGHSKWATTKRQKGVVDVKRGKVFTKLANLITVAAKTGGGSPDANPTLRLAIDRARAENMPRENIERAIKRGTGELEGVTLEEFSYDVVGPSGSALLIEGVTDNKNRTLSELRKLLQQYGAKMAETGSQRWQFLRTGVVLVASTPEKHEQVELTAIEGGAEDVRTRDNAVEVLVGPDKLEQVKKSLVAAGLQVDSATLTHVAKNPLSIDVAAKAKIQELVGALLDSDDVQSVITNLA